MTIATELDVTLALFSDDDHGVHLHGAAQDFSARAFFSGDPLRKAAARFFNRIAHDIWNIATMAERLARTRQQLRNEDLDSVRRSRYLALDVAFY
jgi:hypothetical protein